MPPISHAQCWPGLASGPAATARPAQGAIRTREAGPADIAVGAEFLRAMIGEMACCGGHAVAEGDAALAWLRARLAAGLDDPDHLLLLAESGSPNPAVLGVVEASVVTLEPLFEPQRVLHIHAVYVQPAHRRQGLGRQLVETALEWGRLRGCLEAELNVLTGNPACRLYESIGFTPVEVRMERRL